MERKCLSFPEYGRCLTLANLEYLRSFSGDQENVLANIIVSLDVSKNRRGKCQRESKFSGVCPLPKASLNLNVFFHSAPSFLSTALAFTLARVVFLFPIFLGAISSFHEHDLVFSAVIKIRLVYKLGHPSVDCYVK